MPCDSNFLTWPFITLYEAYYNFYKALCKIVKYLPLKNEYLLIFNVKKF